VPPLRKEKRETGGTDLMSCFPFSFLNKMKEDAICVLTVSKRKEYMRLNLKIKPVVS
jgi:hypothetical protein